MATTDPAQTSPLPADFEPAAFTQARPRPLAAFGALWTARRKTS